MPDVYHGTREDGLGVAGKAHHAAQRDVGCIADVHEAMFVHQIGERVGGAAVAAALDSLDDVLLDALHIEDIGRSRAHRQAVWAAVDRRINKGELFDMRWMRFVHGAASPKARL
ncbi:MAG: hypothetical protein CV045_12850 [Cyanobacteria bacterium M5B4]|nr:MAG: hypothetical protein CV045_12850 [Cyanobacteria bacterium M5B4]